MEGFTKDAKGGTIKNDNKCEWQN